MKKIISIILSAAIVLTSFSACSFGGVKQVNDSLTIYMDSSMFVSLNGSIIKFKNENPDININIEKLYSTSPKKSSADRKNEAIAFSQRLSAELMAGKGPDMIFIPKTFFENNDIYQIMKSGTFEDLIPYINKDESFPKEQLNMEVVESVKFDNKLYLIPLTYNTSCLVTTQSALDETGIDIRDNKYFNDILKDMSGYIESAGNIENRRKITRQTKTLANYPLFLQDDILDYKKGTANIVGNEIFKEASGLYKSIYKDEIITTGYQEDGTSATTVEFDNRSIVFSKMKTGPSYIPVWEGQIKKLADVPKVMPIHNSDGEMNGQIVTACGINSNSPNKQIAYNLISYLLKEEQQNNIFPDSIPINKVSFKNIIPDYIRYCYIFEETELENGGVLFSGTMISGKTEEYKEYASDELTQEELDEYYNLTQSVTKGYFPTPQTDSEIWNDMEPYFKGEKSYEECAQALQDRLDIYMSE